MKRKKRAPQTDSAERKPRRPATVDRVWLEYAERKYGIEFHRHECDTALDRLVATQSEIELIKYRLVQEEGYRAGEPIVVYSGRLGTSYIVDGHTRARVAWDRGLRVIPAVVLTSSHIELDAEFARIAEAVSEARVMHVWDVPVIDRLGEGTAAWRRRRAELHRKLHRGGDR